MSDMVPPDFRIGEHAQAIRILLMQQSKMADDLEEIKILLAEQRGQRKVAAWVAGGIASAVSLLFTIGTKLWA